VIRRPFRLTERHEFSRCFDEGRKVFSPNFIVFAAYRGNGEEIWRMGMAITKKIGKAVRRNRIRRLVRESFRLSGHCVPCGFDFVVVPKRGLDIGALTLHSLSAELAPVFDRVSRFRPKTAHTLCQTDEKRGK
jgi:ribonuclease P protein component, eubacterial